MFSGRIWSQNRCSGADHHYYRCRWVEHVLWGLRAIIWRSLGACWREWSYYCIVLYWIVAVTHKGTFGVHEARMRMSACVWWPLFTYTHKYIIPLPPRKYTLNSILSHLWQSKCTLYFKVL